MDAPEARIKQKAFELGFQSCGISRAQRHDLAGQRLQQWLDEGMNGPMNYMAANVEKRIDPRLLTPATQSIISVSMNYFTQERQTDPRSPTVAKYAYGDDYHLIIRERLYALLQFIQTEIAPCEGRAFTDSAPIMEKVWAANAGLGWLGKNTCLISHRYGSFFFIGELFVSLSLRPDEPVKARCGACRRCIDACPTGALVAPYILDARRCIACQTIELRDAPDATLLPRFGNRIFGCDRCQNVCPWNSRAVPHNEPALRPNRRMLALLPDEWHNMTEETFADIFRYSAIRRMGFNRMKLLLKELGNHAEL
ncbi:MAG: tRNA epoxyqueuosine(34) reductase QueG [Bacteroidales bacterium]|jgi:epoxyqueuosine reductase|nr:tRNA epoxyqueuosine(34) reductase QueG [Bacteroidales bacterium]